MKRLSCRLPGMGAKAGRLCQESHEAIEMLLTYEKDEP